MAPANLPLSHDDPQQLGPYRLIARLGSGGMGTVYLGRDAGGRAVALKTMHAQIAVDPEFRIRFRLEADAARVIGGRYGAAVVDADPLAEIPWLATEYVLGPPLDEAVERCGPLPEASVRALGAALCEAMGQLHRSSVVHRDLKPSNILLSVSGPKVIDFGIARAIGDDRLTRTGTAAGTPAYMSPEQAGGAEHTPAGDVFALAGVLVFAAAGHAPFGGGQAADLIYRVRYGEPDLGGVPRELLALLRHCLSKDAAQRPGMAELGARLRDHNGEFVEFADHLPDGVLAETARRSTDVWQIVPHRLPPPPGGTFGSGTDGMDGQGPTRPASGSGTAPDRRGTSRRKMLAMAGGSGLAVAAVSAGAWAWSDRGEGETPAPGASPSRMPNGAPYPVWRAATTSFTDSDVPPLLVGGLVVTSSRDGLVALDARTGKRRWTSPGADDDQITTDGERLYEIGKETVRGKGVTVHSLNPRTGRRAERLGTLPDFDGTPHGDNDDPTTQPLAAAEGLLYLAARPRRANASRQPLQQGWYVLAFDLRAGKEKWRVPIKQYDTSFSTFGDRVSAYVAKPAGKRLVLARPRNDYSSPVQTVAAWDTETGEELWDAKPLPREMDDDAPLFPGGLPTDGKHVYFGSGQVVALRLSDGKEAWRFESAGIWNERAGKDLDEQVALYGPPTVHDGVVYAAEWNHGLVAMDAGSGTLLWKEKRGGPAPDLDVPPMLGEKYVYVSVGGHKYLSAVSRRTHRSVWRFHLTGDGREDTGERFVVHERARRIIGRTSGGAYAIPLE